MQTDPHLTDQQTNLITWLRIQVIKTTIPWSQKPGVKKKMVKL